MDSYALTQFNEIIKLNIKIHLFLKHIFSGNFFLLLFKKVQNEEKTFES